MKLSKLIKLIQKHKWIKPVKENIKVGDIISYNGSFGLEFCKITRITNNFSSQTKYWGYWAYNLKDVELHKNTYYEQCISFESIKGVLN